ADRAIRQHAANGLVWRAEVFQTIEDQYARSLIDDIYSAISLTARTLDAARLARKAVNEAQSLHVLGQVSDAMQQIDALVWAGPGSDGFVSRTGLAQLERVPVYLEAVRLRMAGLTENPGRDRAWQNEIDRATALYSEAGGEFPAPLDAPEHLVRTRWLIEDRKSTRLNSSHVKISYAVFCLKKK